MEAEEGHDDDAVDADEGVGREDFCGRIGGEERRGC